MNPQPRRRTLLLSAAALGGTSLIPFGRALAQSGATATATPPRLDVPYVPTPQEVVDKMLDLAKVGKNDVLYDLGCGDGRIVVTAAKERGARGTGIDLDPARIAEARENAKKAGVSERASFRVGDLFKTDVSSATVVTLYLLPTVNAKLRPQLWKQLKVGTRVVSHAFDMGSEWPAEKTVEVDGRTIYYWTITEANKKEAAA
ncbi:class I SAM-dependent methyltransferase [Massilia sp. YIM B02443]|uniref:class I SAM-dependent methyltransferase n=1 Tax=Massilia sp. YIM B02443 TaxID=3050127 RepID=UPI0025B6E4F0|nr:class I SAM-dependent methyltransferase [Massilia sp. YIM B02443]MDN4039327.1 class I SAM-dependent methyltransferase [Massilia sp. YIM B02443]